MTDVIVMIAFIGMGLGRRDFDLHGMPCKDGTSHYYLDIDPQCLCFSKTSEPQIMYI